MDLVGKMTAIAGQTMKMLADFDAWLYVLLGRMEERLGLYKVARSISFTGDGYAYLLIAVLLLLLVPETGLAVTISGVVAFAMELPAYVVLKKASVVDAPSTWLVLWHRFTSLQMSSAFPLDMPLPDF